MSNPTKKPNQWRLLVTPFIGFMLSCSNPVSQSEIADKKPNILLIVADDLGYADLGCYGGDIHTPVLDSMAATGFRFSRFHAAPLCAVTRAMLLSGNDNHTAGMGIQGESTNEYGYEGRIMNRVAIIPEVLKQADYHTYITGKWHLGNGESNPANRGFDRSFVNIAGAGNHYNSQSLFAGNATTPYTEDGKTASWPEGSYSTNVYTDKLIGFIDENLNAGKPFFAFAAYTAPHWPLQVDESFSEKYRGRYNDGYEALKASRLSSLKEAGMVPADAVLPPSHGSVMPWDSLSPEEQEKESKKMELYAGMVDNLDHNIGRLLNYLRKKGELENTVIIFMSDNGAAAEDFYYSEVYGPFLKKHFTDDVTAMGKPNSFIAYGPQWAEAGTSPFRYFKGEATEGAVIAPMILAGKGIPESNLIYPHFVSIVDIAPALYQIAGVPYPQKLNGVNRIPMRGKSFIASLKDLSPVHDSTDVLVIEHSERIQVRKGNWKLANIDPPFIEENFKLYNLATDPAEQHDLRKSNPAKYKEMLAEWKKFAQEVKVQIPTPVKYQ